MCLSWIQLHSSSLSVSALRTSQASLNTVGTLPLPFDMSPMDRSFLALTPVRTPIEAGRSCTRVQTSSLCHRMRMSVGAGCTRCLWGTSPRRMCRASCSSLSRSRAPGISAYHTLIPGGRTKACSSGARWRMELDTRLGKRDFTSLTTNECTFSARVDTRGVGTTYQSLRGYLSALDRISSTILLRLGKDSIGGFGS